jgi:hypothetical protein
MDEGTNKASDCCPVDEDDQGHHWHLHFPLHNQEGDEARGTYDQWHNYWCGAPWMLGASQA